MKPTLKTIPVVLAATVLSAASAMAVELIPSSYSFSASTDVGSYSYHDETGNQLIDGQYGVAPWTADLGNGNAYEWVGWVWDSPVHIDFAFSSILSIGEIRVGTVQDWVGDVVIPDVTVSVPDGLGGWTPVKSVLTPESSANNDVYRTLILDNLGISASSVRVSLAFSLDGPWTFTDEVDFYSASSVPDVGATWMFGGLALVGLAGMRRRMA